MQHSVYAVSSPQSSKSLLSCKLLGPFVLEFEQAILASVHSTLKCITGCIVYSVNDQLLYYIDLH